ncbi:MAG TPA: hypothetical protein VNI35_01480 [Nitrospira sp.]|nr:hypothetical protein [Nitrospira sp.]
MALTDRSDIFASVHERSFNNIVLQLQAQRPSLFNYGTMTFVSHPELLCNQTNIRRVDPEVKTFGNPIVKEEPLLSIPGYDGPYGLEYCLQIAELSIDFHPSNVHSLPAELSPPLAPQHFSLKGRACAGLDCPSKEVLGELAPEEKAFFPTIGNGNGLVQQPGAPLIPGKNPSPEGPVVTRPTRPFPFNRKDILCFCLDLFAVLHVQREGGTTPAISLRLDNLELVDIKPDGLENAAECFLKVTLMMSVLPKVKLALDALILSVGKVLTIGPTPISSTVPFNPAIEDDQIKAFITVTV